VKWLEKPIFVTGATGFIGGRVCERLVQAGAPRVRALVHTVQHASRIARLPVELCTGSLLDAHSLGRAIGDSKIVIHCGLGVGRGIARGTKDLLEVAESAHIERFVHLSTAAVYGLTPLPGSETEDTPPRPTGDPYCDNKIRAEQVVSRFVRRGVPAVILRPSIVYGPYSGWSSGLISALREHQVALIDHGRGACNTTYVDNLVDAIFSSVENDGAIGETFFITDGEKVTWGDFIRAHAAMLDERPELPEISKEDVLAYYRQQPGFWTASFKEARRVLFSPEFRKLILPIPACQRVLALVWRSIESMGEGQKNRIRTQLRGTGKALPMDNGSKKRYIPDPVKFATETTTVFFRIDKARRMLGYEPRIHFGQGIKLVEQWLRFANYL
jgi:nucleoside-diphosphate-sugar epimerase